MKLNILLALTDQLRVKYKNMVADYSKFFNKSQGSFKGEKRTYSPREGVIDDPSKRGITRIATTVDEKINYFIAESSQFIDSLFSQERTNALGLAQAELMVNNKSWGTFTSLELLRLKTLLESSDLGSFESLLASIPVRSDSEVWNKSNDPDYADRNVYETEQITGVSKTTIKEEFILDDPNLSKLKGAEYRPMKSMKDIVHELGDYTKQTFSGEWSHQQRATALKRRGDLIAAITVALKEANEAEAEKSELTAEKIFNYIFKGK
jgi:hypothetical protein